MKGFEPSTFAMATDGQATERRKYGRKASFKSGFLMLNLTGSLPILLPTPRRRCGTLPKLG